mmetsp:Transcript_99091/g.289095  ORF Transcript_99091/g.289095 Transcript_99091/m.289095 type:complete len:123 (-) Transcript_99091:39-407(-)
MGFTQKVYLVQRLMSLYMCVSIAIDWKVVKFPPWQACLWFMAFLMFKCPKWPMLSILILMYFLRVAFRRYIEMKRYSGVSGVATVLLLITLVLQCIQLFFFEDDRPKEEELEDEETDEQKRE